MAQSRPSSLNTNSTSNGGACQRVVHTLEEHTSLAEKFAQQLSSPSTCQKKMLGICSINKKSSLTKKYINTYASDLDVC